MYATGFRFVLIAEPSGTHPKAPRASVWRQRSDDEHFWMMTVFRRGANLELVAQAVATLIIDGAVSFLPVVLLPPNPGMAIFQRSGAITDNLGERLTRTASLEIQRIGSVLRGKHLDFVKDVAAFFRTGEMREGVCSDSA